MVDEQLHARGIRDAAVLEAMKTIPREAFLPVDLAHAAYRDTPLPIGDGQTISQPYVVALMASALCLRPGDRALEIGTGSGYAAAILSLVAGQVYTVERNPRLATEAEERFHALGLSNIALRCGDGSLGWPDAAPFEGIMVSASGPRVPPELREQLTV
ncbi:MAG: protein-L-isoaspartate(D-aspartate) O-methyltransferase, partial [Phycisphaerae bacterium]|nr:protein-L-isoaspartate(D-aspartate) O-methyltransferase [Phycisphaerae bacterium]